MHGKMDIKKIDLCPCPVVTKFVSHISSELRILKKAATMYYLSQELRDDPTDIADKDLK